MDDAALLTRMQSGMPSLWAMMAVCSEGGHAIELDGVRGSVIPAVPERSVMNSVFYDDAAALGPALDELARHYDAAGIQAWTVWVKPGDREAAALLERGGHVLDADPAAMAMELEGFGEGAPDSVDWVERDDPALMAELNDAAYGYEGTPFGTALAGWPAGSGHIYFAMLDGRPASVVQSYDQEGDCGIYWVATSPEARGRGLADALMRQACADAVERGCETTSLQATKAGEPLYARLGYRSLGNFEMWERRRA